MKGLGYLLELKDILVEIGAFLQVVHKDGDVVHMRGPVPQAAWRSGKWAHIRQQAGAEARQSQSVHIVNFEEIESKELSVAKKNALFLPP